MLEHHALYAISPLDGRYKKQLDNLSCYFSEYALIKYRVYVEIEYLIALSEHKIFELPVSKIKVLRNIVNQFDLEDAQRIKDIEKVTNHDVKSVEYFLKETLTSLNLKKQLEWVHFGLTSQDINNTAIPLLWKDAIQFEYIPFVIKMIGQLKQFAKDWRHVPMLARTHGQPASPTSLGKEMMVFVERLENQLDLLKSIPFASKFGGATGNFNAHYVAFPEIDWKKFANHFVNRQLGLKRMQFTTQIEHYDSLAAHFDAMKRIPLVLHEPRFTSPFRKQDLEVTWIQFDYTRNPATCCRETRIATEILDLIISVGNKRTCICGFVPFGPCPLLLFAHQDRVGVVDLAQFGVCFDLQIGVVSKPIRVPNLYQMSIGLNRFFSRRAAGDFQNSVAFISGHCI